MNKIGYLLVLVMTAGCVEERLDDSRDCPPGIACTEIFLSIPITVVDSQGAPVSLDEYYTTRVETGEKIDLQNAESDSMRKTTGKYPVLNDNYVRKILRSGTEFEFIGKKSGKVIVRETYEIGHDCCHITLISGNNTVTVTN
jgi:hypothetical protein